MENPSEETLFVPFKYRNGTFKCFAFRSFVYCYVQWDGEKNESYETFASIYLGEFRK